MYPFCSPPCSLTIASEYGIGQVAAISSAERAAPRNARVKSLRSRTMKRSERSRKSSSSTLRSHSQATTSHIQYPFTLSPVLPPRTKTRCCIFSAWGLHTSLGGTSPGPGRGCIEMVGGRKMRRRKERVYSAGSSKRSEWLPSRSLPSMTVSLSMPTTFSSV